MSLALGELEVDESVVLDGVAELELSMLDDDGVVLCVPLLLGVSAAG
jgi:hypothetical protein